MNNTNSKEQAIRRYIRSIIKEALLTEKFASPTLAKLAQSINSENKLEWNKVLRSLGLAWDQIPESAVTVDSAGSDTIKKAVNDKSKLIVWISPDKKQLVHWKPTTYSKYGSKRDNSIYLHPNTILVSQGKNYLTGYGNIAQKSIATDRYQKPLDGAMSVTKLMTDIDAIALIIDLDAVKAADTTPLQQSRRRAKSGATALENASDILRANKARYHALIVKGKGKKLTADLTKRVEEAVAKLKSDIEAAAQTTVANLIQYGERSKYAASNPDFPLTQTKVNIGKVNFDELDKIVAKYNILIGLYAEYIENAQIYARLENPSRSWEANSFNRSKDDLERALAEII